MSVAAPTHPAGGAGAHRALATTWGPRVPSQCEAMLGLVRTHAGSHLGRRDPHALGPCGGARAAMEKLPGFTLQGGMGQSRARTQRHASAVSKTQVGQKPLEN